MRSIRSVATVRRGGIALAVIAALALLLIPSLAARAVSDPAPTDGTQLAHTVVFALKDHSPEARAKFVASCHKYLSGHEGTVSFAVSTIAGDVLEPSVGDRDFDVILHMVFADKTFETKYIANPRHKAFVAENSGLFGKVRVFDSYVTKP